MDALFQHPNQSHKVRFICRVPRYRQFASAIWNGIIGAINRSKVTKPRYVLKIINCGLEPVKPAAWLLTASCEAYTVKTRTSGRPRDLRKSSGVSDLCVASHSNSKARQVQGVSHYAS